MQPNDFIYYDGGHYPHTNYLVIAGGQVRVPMWLAWSTYGIILSLLVVGMVFEGALSDGTSWWCLITLVVISGIPLALLMVSSVIAGLIFFIRSWVRVLRGEKID